MYPESVVLEFHDGITQLDACLTNLDIPEPYLDEYFGTMIDTLRNRREALADILAWTDTECVTNPKYGEILSKTLENIARLLYRKLLDLTLYPSDGRLPYAFSGRLGNGAIVLTWYE
jgi:hypothetical protein